MIEALANGYGRTAALEPAWQAGLALLGYTALLGDAAVALTERRVVP